MVIDISKDKQIFILHKVSPLDIALSMKHLVTMITSGLALDEALDVLVNQVEDPMLKKIYREVQVDVTQGISLTEAMKKHNKVFSKMVISVIDIGEQGGTLEKNLAFLAQYLKKQYELKRKIGGATTYPIIVFVLTILEMVGVVFFVLPRLESVFSGLSTLPPITAFILNLAKFLRENYPLVILGLIILYIIIKLLLNTKPGERFKDFMALHLPIFKNINKKQILADFSRTLGILLESGVPFQKAIGIAADTIDNSYYKDALLKMTEMTKDGKNLFESIGAFPNLFPPTFVKIIETGENTGNLEDNLNYLYEFYTEEVLELSNNLTTLLEPVLLIFAGLMIGGLALMIITPIYQLTGSLNTQ